jgi:hypothetical protein
MLGKNGEAGYPATREQSHFSDSACGMVRLPPSYPESEAATFIVLASSLHSSRKSLAADNSETLANDVRGDLHRKLAYWDLTLAQNVCGFGFGYGAGKRLEVELRHLFGESWTPTTIGTLRPIRGGPKRHLPLFSQSV